MGRRSRALFSLLLAGETRKAETRKEEPAMGAQGRVKDEKKISKARDLDRRVRIRVRNASSIPRAILR